MSETDYSLLQWQGVAIVADRVKHKSVLNKEETSFVFLIVMALHEHGGTLIGTTVLIPFKISIGTRNESVL
jgi:hypothetical protein